MTSELTRNLHSRVDWVKYRAARYEGRQVVKDFVTQCWESGKLPHLVRKGVWLVGWSVHKTFFNVYSRPILVGPKKPTRLRERHYNNVDVSAGV
jgi:hypothetical protein